jgi:probable HAF family extracellular repeat protein
MIRSLASIFLSLVAAAALITANPCAAQSYTLTDLGPSVYDARAINNNGQIVGPAAPSGASTSSNLSDPYLLSNGTLTDLGNFGNPQGAGAYAVNSLGQVVGLAGTADGGQKPFLFSNGTLTQLPNGGTPLGINTAGSIVGYFYPTACESLNQTHAFVIKNGVFTDLSQPTDPSQPCNVLSEAHGINTSGQIAGASNFEASVWQPDGTLTLVGFLPGENYSRAFAINDAGQVAGTALTTVPQYSQHSFLFSNGQMTDIDTFHSQASWAFGINNNGVVVGMFTPSPTSMAYDAFVYMGGSMMDLNTLIPAGSGLTLIQANGINDAGEIVGQSQSNSDGSVHGFLLTPVPPQIASISPTSAKAGALVTITGKNFTKKPNACTVTFNGKVAKWTSWSNTKITAQVPTGATTGKVVVTAFFQKSNSKTFTVK